MITELAPLFCLQHIYFQVTDKSGDNSGGKVELVGGGFNQRYVEFRFESETGKGLNYNILSYGK